MIAYVYETKNNINGKTYTGCTINDLEGGSGYMGSGALLIKAFKQFGKENFTRKILFKCSSIEIAFKVEKLLIADMWKKSSNYNSSGGGGGYVSRSGEDNGFSGKSHSKVSKNRISRNNARHWEGKTLSDEHKAKISKALRKKMIKS